MSRPNVVADGPYDVEGQQLKIRSLFAVATRAPFAAVSDGGDAGVVGMFDLPAAEERLQKPDI